MDKAGKTLRDIGMLPVQGLLSDDESAFVGLQSRIMVTLGGSCPRDLAQARSDVWVILAECSLSDGEGVFVKGKRRRGFALCETEVA